MNNKKSFTLIELLAVIAIMGILASLMLPALNKARDRARVSKCVATIASLQTALSMYQVDYGFYPASTGVNTLQHNGNSKNTTDPPDKRLVEALTATTLGGPYMEFKGKDLDSTETVLLDPWGQAYIYVSRKAKDGSTVSSSYGPFHPDTTTVSNNTYNIYSLGTDKKTYLDAKYSDAGGSDWDLLSMYNHANCGDWDSTSTSTDDDINSWDGAKKGE